MSTRIFQMVAFMLAAGAWSPASAQSHATDQGSWIVGGGAGLSNQSFSYSLDGDRLKFSSTYASLTPRVQYFVRPGLALGGGLNLAHMRTDDHSSTRYGAGPAISYYFTAPERRILPYVSANTSFSRARGEEGRETGYGAAAGLLYMLTGSVGLDGSVFAQSQRWTETNDLEGTNRVLGLALGFSAFVY